MIITGALRLQIPSEISPAIPPSPSPKSLPRRLGREGSRDQAAAKAKHAVARKHLHPHVPTVDASFCPLAWDEGEREMGQGAH